jgi:hypothetical protein
MRLTLDVPQCPEHEQVRPGTAGLRLIERVFSGPFRTFFGRTSKHDIHALSSCELMPLACGHNKQLAIAHF